eukprot:CAMPEP_0170515394 /NCGR_PEP_ID=MMETSP0209-20121228/1834_1 /TAXON_ID=665100 ORGANISM="Litonotus pictus, Strain P1" /NCGR_SAMPLE_ID=MMETSP0209 /ASSEMBLY_ACC=CAM_ASM_000301 /LENGTH=308 /DNA_ID=CAMNT_0010799863 /DNA_START=9 /DNA_END=936 /DNA_ORIENTATION=-
MSLFSTGSLNDGPTNEDSVTSEEIEGPKKDITETNQNMIDIVSSEDDDGEEDALIEEELRRQESLTLKSKFSKINIDVNKRARFQSTKVLNHNIYKLEDDVTKIEEEIRFELGEKSEYVLDPSETFYSKRANSMSPGLLPNRYNTSNIIGHSYDISGKVEKKEPKEKAEESHPHFDLKEGEKKEFQPQKMSKNVKFSVRKVVFEYPDHDLPDFVPEKKSKKKNMKNIEKVVVSDSSEDDDSGLTQKEKEKLAEIKKKREEAQIAKKIEDLKNKKKKEELQAKLNEEKESKSKSSSKGKKGSKSKKKNK